MIELSKIAPDFDSIRAQLVQQAAAYPSWKDRIISSSGQTLVDMVAAMGAYSQYAIESAYQETWPDSAKNSEALYAAASYAGVRISRKSCAVIQVPLKSPVNITIPPYTQFVGAGTYWFNRTAITLVANVPLNTALFQGEIVIKNISGVGSDFQAYVSPESGFSASDTDVLVSIDDVSVAVTNQGLWTLKGVPGAQQFTLPKGNLIVMFGNSFYGSVPAINNMVKITYVITQGNNGNNIVTLNKDISLSADGQIKGTCTVNPTGGGDEPNALIYKSVTPGMFGAFDSSVTANQNKLLPIQYPGVLDAKVLSQREINPMALTYMNTLKICLLTQSPWTLEQRRAFEAWFYERTMVSPRLIWEDPVPAGFNLKATVSCKTNANLTEVKANCEKALINLTKKQQGILGRDVYRTDLSRVMFESDSNVEFIELGLPSLDLILSAQSLAAPVLTPTIGNLSPGIYDYAVGYTSIYGGMSAPAKWSSYQLTNQGGVNIAWEGISTATLYHIYGRATQQTGNIGLLATIPAVANQVNYNWTDNNSILPSGTVPAQSTISSYYPVLSSIDLTMKYTVRNIR